MADFVSFVASDYTGRSDPLESDRSLYWHQMVQGFDYQRIGLIGFASHEGVKRNLGRIGANSGPAKIRQFFAKLPITPAIQDACGQLDHLVGDAGEVVCEDLVEIMPHSLESAQALYADKVTEILAQNSVAIGLGGGHEIAFGSFLGLYQFLKLKNTSQKIGIINFDAHFDLRTDEYATSGTPFLQISEMLGRDFAYFCVGISRFGNTASLFDKANQLGVGIISDDECHRLSYDEIWQRLAEFIEAVDVLYVTVDLDCLPAGVMPAVSAVNPKGIDLDLLEFLLTKIIDTHKVKVLDFAEFNPAYDIDDRGAKVAARLLAVCVEQLLLTSHSPTI